MNTFPYAYAPQVQIKFSLFTYFTIIQKQLFCFIICNYGLTTPSQNKVLISACNQCFGKYRPTEALKPSFAVQ